MFADLAYAAGYHASLTPRVIMPHLRRGLSCFAYAAGCHFAQISGDLFRSPASIRRAFV